MIEAVFARPVDDWKPEKPPQDPNVIAITPSKIPKEFWPQIGYSEVKKKAFITIHDKMTITLSPNIADMLGFDNEVIEVFPKRLHAVVLAQHIASMHKVNNIMFC